MASSFFTFLIIFFTISPIPQLVLTRPNLIPPHISQLDSWIVHNMKDYDNRKAAGQTTAANFDPQLAAAEEAVQLITVRKDGTGNFTTVSDAVRSVPSGNTRRFVLAIGGGEYFEKVLVDASRPFVTFYGDQNDMPSIVFDGTALQYGTWNSCTVAVESDYFMAVNIAFVNSAPMPDGVKRGAQAVAMRISGDKAAFHNCKFIGFQDTLLDDRGRHFFKDCYIQGTVDFIFGNGKSLYLGNTLRSVANGTGVITAHARENVEDDSGFAFVHCNITGTGDTFLGRAWRERPRVVFAYTYMDSLINREGWSDATHKERDQTVYYGEYKCMGPGSSASGRVKYAKMLSDEEAKPFLSMTFIRGTKWVLPAPKL